MFTNHDFFRDIYAFSLFDPSYIYLVFMRLLSKLIGMPTTLALWLALWLTSPVQNAVAAEYAALNVEKLVSEEALASKLKFYASLNTLEAPFTQIKHFSEMPMKLTSEGRLKLTRPDQVVWEVTSPRPVKVTLDHEAIHIETGKGAQALVQTFKTSDAGSAGPSRSMAELAAWLNLDARSISQQYQVYGKGADSFRFIPRAPSSTSFRSLEMNLVGVGHLKKLTIFEMSGDWVEIEFGPPKVTRPMTNRNVL